MACYQAVSTRSYIKSEAFMKKFHEAAVVLNEELELAVKYKLHDTNYEDILTYKAEYNCESMLEKPTYFLSTSNSMGRLKFL